MKRNLTQQDRTEAWLAIGEYLNLLTSQEPLELQIREDMLGVEECWRNVVSAQDLAFAKYGEREERTYDGSHTHDDGSVDMESDYFLGQEPKNGISKGAESADKNPLNWMAEAEVNLQNEFRAELCRVGTPAHHVAHICRRLFGGYAFQGYITQMEPAPVIISRLCAAWKKTKTLPGGWPPNKALSKIHRLCELRHDIKSQDDWQWQGEEPGDTPEVYDELADGWRGGDADERVLSGAHKYADLGISHQRQDVLTLDNVKLMNASAELRGRMDVEPSIKKKILAAREYIKDSVKHKTSDGKRTVPWHIEHKLLGVALACLTKAGQRSGQRLFDVCEMWSTNGFRIGMIPYSYKGISRNMCSESYLSKQEEVHAAKAKAEYLAHIGEMQAHWAAMEQTGVAICKRLDDPNYKPVVEKDTRLLIHKREALKDANGYIYTKTTQVGMFLYPMMGYVKVEEVAEITPEDVDVEYLESHMDETYIDQDLFLEDEILDWDE